MKTKKTGASPYKSAPAHKHNRDYNSQRGIYHALTWRGQESRTQTRAPFAWLIIGLAVAALVVIDVWALLS